MRFQKGETRRKNTMAKVVKVIELLSELPRSWEDAAQSAIKEASKTLRNIRSLLHKRNDRCGRERQNYQLSP